MSNEKALNPLDYLDLPTNRYLGEPQDILLGRKLKCSKILKNKKRAFIKL